MYLFVSACLFDMFNLEHPAVPDFIGKNQHCVVPPGAWLAGFFNPGFQVESGSVTVGACSPACGLKP